jgi:hypothetical protein
MLEDVNLCEILFPHHKLGFAAKLPSLLNALSLLPKWNVQEYSVDSLEKEIMKIKYDSSL